MKRFFSNPSTQLILGFFTVLVIVYLVGFHPYKKYDSVLELREVDANWPFAGNIRYKGEVIGASSELCVWLWINQGATNMKTIPIQVEERLFQTKRYPNLKTNK